MNTVILIGCMGCGKTSVGKRLSGLSGSVFVDTDELCEQAEGTKIAQMFAQKGEAYFRDLEHKVLEELCLREEPMIISAGGGAATFERNRLLMRRLGEVIYLKTSGEELERRLRGDTSRPLLQGYELRQRIDTLLRERETDYLLAADRIVSTDGKTPREVAEEILRLEEIPR